MSDVLYFIEGHNFRETIGAGLGKRNGKRARKAKAEMEELFRKRSRRYLSNNNDDDNSFLLSFDDRGPFSLFLLHCTYFFSSFEDRDPVRKKYYIALFRTDKKTAGGGNRVTLLL